MRTPVSDHLRQPVDALVRTDFATLSHDLTVGQAFDEIRAHGLGDRIVYFYVVDGDGGLVGVVPTRRLLTAPLDAALSSVMVDRVVAIPSGTSVLEACEFFVLHKLLAFPVVDAGRRIVGVVDVGMFTDEVFDVVDQERMAEVFETIGFRVSQVRDASAGRAFRFRFPWLLATIGSGVVCALLVSRFEMTLARSLVLAFFMTMVLGLGESVAIQSMTVAIQTLRTVRPTFGWFVRAIRRETGVAMLLGAACGAAVLVVVALWHGAGRPAVAIGGGIALAVWSASLIGLAVPAVLHALKLDLRIAAGPLTLAFADISTLLFYFGLATLLL